MLPKLKKHIFLWSSIIVLMAGAAFANLTSHTEALLNTLLLTLDSTHNGAISDEAWYSAFITSTEIGAAYDTEAEFNNLFSGKQAADADLTTWAGITPGANVGTALAIAIGTAGAPIVFDGALGTPSSGTLTNCTGYPETGDVSSVLDDTGGAAPVLLQASTAFSEDNATPSVTGHSFFRTANVNPTTITDFLNPTDGQIIWVLVNDAVTTFSFSGGIEGYSTSFLADNGAVYNFYYDATDTNWHMKGVPSTISISAIYDTVPFVDADAVTRKMTFNLSGVTAGQTSEVFVPDLECSLVADSEVSATGIITDFALAADADVGDYDITSIDKLEGVDATEYIDMGADGYVDIYAGTSIRANCDIVTTGDEIRSAGAANPYISVQDSDAAGAEYTDEETVKFYGQQTTTTEDGEIGDFRIAAVGAGTAGTWYTHVFWDGSGDTLSLGTLTDSDAPAAVADNEDLVIDFDTANDNEITIATDSGATDIRSSLQITDTKKITADIDNEAMTIAQMGQVWTNTGDGDGTIFTLPEASTWIGKSVTFVLTVAQTLTINPNDGADTILYLGCAAGDAIQADAIGETITVMAIDATNIAVFGPLGTWADVN